MRRRVTILAAVLGVASAGAPAIGRQIDGLTRSVVEVQPSARSSTDTLGAVRFGPVGVETIVSPPDPRILGVAYGWGHFWVSGRAAATTAGHKIYKLDLNGGVVATFAQTSQSAFWGGRDGAANEPANKLYFGEDNSKLVEYNYLPATGGIAFSRSIDLAAIVGGTYKGGAFAIGKELPGAKLPT